MTCSSLHTDLENLGHRSLNRLIAAVERTPGLPPLRIRRAYAHWEVQPAKSLEAVLNAGFDPLVVSEHGTDSADALIQYDIAAMLKYMPTIGAFIIASGDRGFRPTLEQIKAHKRVAVLCCPEQTASPVLISAADIFIPIPPSPDPTPTPAQPAVVPENDIDREGVVLDVPTATANMCRVVLDLIRADSAQLRDGGLPLSSLADTLRPLRNPQAGKNRWLLKLVQSACAYSELHIAKSKDGDQRIFLRGCVPPSYFSVDLPASPSKAIDANNGSESDFQDQRTVHRIGTSPLPGTGA
jgi:hypothetical protein